MEKITETKTKLKTTEEFDPVITETQDFGYKSELLLGNEEIKNYLKPDPFKQETEPENYFGNSSLFSIQVNNLVDQLNLKKTRYESFKSHIQEIKEQVSENRRMSICQLQSKRNALIQNVDELFELEISKLNNRYFNKENEIETEEENLASYITEIQSLAKRLQEKNYSSTGVQVLFKKAQQVLAENKFRTSENWLLPIEVEFNYAVVQTKSNLEENYEKEYNLSYFSAGNLDHIIPEKSEVKTEHLLEELVGKFKSLEKKVQHKHKCKRRSASNRKHLPTKFSQQSTPKVGLSEASMDSVPKYKLDASAEMPPVSCRISISTLLASKYHHKLNNNQLKVFVPQGYPPYSCYYIVTFPRKTTASDLLQVLIYHMDLSGNYYLTYKLGSLTETLSYYDYLDNVPVSANQMLYLNPK